MALVDRQGRLFGRLNLLDAMGLLLLLGLLPLAFGAYAMFRAPSPTLTGIEPDIVQAGPNLRVTIHGENLRPYMRVSFGTRQGRTFLFLNTTTAQVDLGEIPPGEYDVILYDHAQERGRLPKALTVAPSPLPDTQAIVVGTLGNLTVAQAGRIVTGMTIPNVGEVVDVGHPLPEVTRVYSGADILEVHGDEAVRLPVRMRMACFVRVVAGRPECTAAGVVLQPTMVLMLATEVGNLPLQIDQVRGTQPLESVQAIVRFVNVPGVIDLMSEGDVDLGQWRNPLAAGARVTRVVEARRISADAALVDVELSLEVQQGTGSWIYSDAPLRVGRPLMFRTALYELQGTVLGLSPEPITVDGEPTVNNQ